MKKKNSFYLIDGLAKIAKGAPVQPARFNLINFATYMQPAYTWNWHHHMLAQKLDDFRAGKIKRLMIFLPPQHGKSEFTSRLFPAFCLGHDPDEKIILGSYSASLAESMNRDVQKYMDTEEYQALFPGVKLPAKGSTGKYVRKAGRIDIDGRRGYFKTVGVGGSMTGTPADKLIIDDPHKDRESAKSPLISQKVYEWYLDVAKTRIHNDAGILLIQTRWDVDDLAGRLLKRMEQAIQEGDTDADIWTVICFPAIKETDDNPEDKRAIGEALWPERHNLQRLRAIRAESLRTFRSLYQQDPMPVQAGGECYKSFHYNTNTGDYTYDPDLPLHLSFDFNVNPYMSCTVWQIQNVCHAEAPEASSHDLCQLPLPTAVLLEEICLRSPLNTTQAVCRHIIDKYRHRHRSTAYIYGDPSGMKEDTRREKGHNDYYIIRQELTELKASFRIAAKAPSVHLRISFMNALFAGTINGLSLHLDRKCTNTIADFLYIKEQSDGTKHKQRATDPVTGISSEKYGHLSDSAEYFICTAFNDKYAQFLQGGKTGGIVVGKRKSKYEY